MSFRPRAPRRVVGQGVATEGSAGVLEQHVEEPDRAQRSTRAQIGSRCRKLMNSPGQLAAHQLVQLCLDRIEAYNKNGPKINAIITVNSKALEDADKLDASRRDHFSLAAIRRRDSDKTGLRLRAGNAPSQAAGEHAAAAE